MVNINVERRGPRLWVWVVVVLALALLAWVVGSLVDAEPELREAPLVEEPAPPAP